MLTPNPSMRRKNRYALLFVHATLLSAVFFAQPAHVRASQDLTAAPAVMDEKGKPRDILKKSIMLSNETDHFIVVFPTVRDVNSDSGQQSFDRAKNAEELSDSLANWIELSRGVIKLGPGEQKEVPFVIRLNPNAVPNTYHAEISFSTGDTRDEAEAGAPLAKVAVNLEVTADIKEIMQLNAFTTDRLVFTGDDVLFNFRLQNIGNQELQPKGEIRVYDRRGKEVAAIDVNKEGKVVAPDQVTQLASVWSAVSGFGKYKALLNVSYGRGQTASVQDTIFFWIIPWKQLFALLVVSLVAIIFFALYFHRWLEERHLGKLAHAGLLNTGAVNEVLSAKSPAPRPGLFSFFRRVKPSVAHMARPQVVEEQKRSAPLPTSPVAPTMESAVVAHTIDLKQIRSGQMGDARESEQPPPQHQGSVINLRKNQ